MTCMYLNPKGTECRFRAQMGKDYKMPTYHTPTAEELETYCNSSKDFCNCPRYIAIQDVFKTV